MSGRLAFRMFLDQYRLDMDRAIELDMRTLWAHEYSGDLALYLDGLDKILLNFNHQPSMQELQGAIIPQLRKAKNQLGPAFALRRG